MNPPFSLFPLFAMAFLSSTWTTYTFEYQVPAQYGHVLVPFPSKLSIIFPAKELRFATFDLEAGKFIPCPKFPGQPLPFETCSLSDTSIFLYGGCSPKHSHVRCLVNQRGSIDCIKCSGNSPKPDPRACHTTIVYNGCIIVYGGITVNNVVLNDLWKYHICLLIAFFIFSVSSFV